MAPSETPSREVRSPQTGPHPRLLEHLARRRHASLRPPAEHTERAASAIWRVLDEAPSQPVILDAGCGTAESCSALAHAHPQAWILGVDQSLHRLGTEGVARPDDRMVTARAELGDLFRLWRVSGRRFEKVYFLYPNPWPKPEHLFRRWHGHPAFPDLLACSAALEARSNWRIYLEEMELALTWFLGPPEAEEPLRAVHRLPPGPPISPFERKYARSGQALFRLTASFDLTPPAENSGPRG